MIRIIAIDIDGTLLNSRGEIPRENSEALAEARARGIGLVLVTGRSAHFAWPVFRSLGLPATLIVNNGAVAKDEAGRTLFRRLLPREAARGVLASTGHFADSVALVFDRGGAGEPSAAQQIVCDRMDWTHPHRTGYYEKNRAFIATMSPLAEALTEDPIQVMFSGTVAAMRRLVDELRASSAAPSYTVSITEYEARDFALIDVSAAGCSKGAALAEWVASQGLSREAVLAAGDNLNDLEMLEFAGTAVVMGNAPPAVNAGGRFHVTATNDEGGLADAIHRFVLGRDGV